MMKRDDEQQQLIDKQQQAINELQQAHESLKHHVMPVDGIIVLQVKYDELTGKVPFVPKFPSWPNRLCSEFKQSRGW
jgi:anion-transporting  ArsA/GET3 family ATPase